MKKVLEIKEHKGNDGKMILSVKGRLDDYNSSRDFRHRLDGLTEGGEKNIVLDLNDVTSLNSHGIAKILVFHDRLKQKGGALYIVKPMRGIVKDIFKAFHLDALLEGYSLAN